MRLSGIRCRITFIVHGRREAPAMTGERQPAARVLILEDSAWDADLAQRLMTSAGLDFQAVVVETRADFTEQLAAFCPDVIVSDFSLPGFSGEEALRIAQE